MTTYVVANVRKLLHVYSTVQCGGGRERYLLCRGLSFQASVTALLQGFVTHQLFQLKVVLFVRRTVRWYDIFQDEASDLDEFPQNHHNE